MTFRKTFQNFDEMMAFYKQFYEQFFADRQREFETGLLLKADEINEDIGDVIEGCREIHEKEIADWRVQMRRHLEELPLKFPVTMRWRDTRPIVSELKIRAVHLEMAFTRRAGIPGLLPRAGRE